MSATEPDDPGQNDVDADELDEEGETPSEMRGGTTEGGWSNVAEEGGASGPGLGASPPGTDI